MTALLSHFIRNPDPMVVPVYDFTILHQRNFDYSLSYEMMRCGILDEDERLFIDHLSWAWDLHDQNVWSRIEAGTCMKWQAELDSESKKLPELTRFLKQVVAEDRYFDLHSGNVMRHEDGQYVLIDLEGFIRTPLEDKRNDWIT